MHKLKCSLNYSYILLVIGGYSHLVPAGTFRVSVLVGFVCPCIMLCLWRVLHCLAARHVIACSTEQPVYLSCRGATQKRHVITC